MSSRRVAARTTDQQSDPKDSLSPDCPAVASRRPTIAAAAANVPQMRGDRALATFAGSHGVAGRALGEE
jgi:hypothetical protein